MEDFTLWRILVGGLIGFIASFFIAGEHDAFPNMAVRIIVYIICGLIGSWLAAVLLTSSGILGFIFSVLGAMVVLAIVIAIARRR